MRTDTEAEASILWPPDMKNWLIRKDPNGGKDWRQEEEGTTESEMLVWHHELDGHEFEQAPGVGDGQGSPAGCSPWGQKELDMTEWLNWTKLNFSVIPTLCDPPRDFPGKNTGVGCHSLHQGMFLTQRLKPHLLHFQWIFFLPSEPPAKPIQCRTGLYMDVLGKRDH